MTRQHVIHIGFPKSASTLLQREIFPNVPGYRFLNREFRGKEGEGYRDLLCTEFVLDIPPEHPFHDLSGEPFIYSAEQFLHFPRNTWTHRRRYVSSIDYRTMALANLKRIFRDHGKFLIVIRRQSDAIASYCNFNNIDVSQSTKVSRLVSGVFNRKDPETRNAPKIFTERKSRRALSISGFNYYRLAIDLASVVGPERVCFLPFEDISTNPERFISRLESVFGERLSGLEDALGRSVNASEKKYTAEMFSGYQDYFASSNRLLDEMFSLGLEELGYY